MSKLYLDLALTVFFLVALVFVYNLRSQIQERQKATINLMSWGLVLLAVMSLLTAVQNQLVAQDVISSATSTVFEFTRTTLFVLGLVLLTSGVARWIPIASRNNNNDNKSSGNDLALSALAIELTQPCTLTEYMSTSLKLLADNVSVDSAALYSIAKAGNQAKLIAVEASVDSLNSVDSEIVFTPGWVNGLSDHALVYADEKVLSSKNSGISNRYCFAVRQSGHPRLLYLINARQRIKNFYHINTVVMAISNSLKSRLANETLSLKHSLYSQSQEISKFLENSISPAGTVNERVSIVRRKLSEYMPVDYISVCAFDENGIGRRVSIGESGTVLNELGVNIAGDSPYLLDALTKDKTQIITDLQELDQDYIPEILKLSKTRSLIVMPLAGVGEFSGAVTVGASGYSAYSSVNREILIGVAGSIKKILYEMMVEESRAQSVKRQRIISEFIYDIARSDTEDDVFNRAATTIANITNSKLVRVATVDVEQKFLSSHALVNESKREIKVPAAGHILLSMLPWHKVSVTNGNTVIVRSGTGQNKMTDVETCQVFNSHVRGVTIVPIRFGDKVYGIISLAEYGDILNDQIGSDNLQFVESIAAILGIYVDASSRTSDALAEFATSARAEIIENSKSKALRSQLRSSLTSIIGSLELIQIGQSGGESKDNRYLSMIGKSAHKLEELLKE